MCYEDPNPDDQVATRSGPRGAAPGPGHITALLVATQPQGLHPAPALRDPVAEDLPGGRLPGHRGVPQGLLRTPRRPDAEEGAPLLDAQLRRRSAAKRGTFIDLLEGAVTSATEYGLIPEQPTVAVDATGLDSRHASRYFLARSGGEQTARSWPKLTAAVDTHSHVIAGATVTTGPTNDSPQFTPVLLLASLLVTWDRVLADAAFDSEFHHRFAREQLGIRSSVIPINTRGRAGAPSGKYRRQMARRFRPKPEGSRHQRVFGQRWQAESAFSRHKRRLGSVLFGRSDESRTRECYLRLLTHNLMLLAAAS
jgi:Transposase DDE domain